MIKLREVVRRVSDKHQCNFELQAWSEDAEKKLGFAKFVSSCDQSSFTEFLQNFAKSAAHEVGLIKRGNENPKRIADKALKARKALQILVTEAEVSARCFLSPDLPSKILDDAFEAVGLEKASTLAE